MADGQAYDSNTCVVCFKNVLYYSIAECDHPVCYECSTRMRVLCLQNECPICRQDLSRVVFTDSIEPYKELRTKLFPDKLFERQFKIGFCSEDIKAAYDRLLENRCCFCPKLPPFRTFNMLNDHMRKNHEKFYCDLCVKHLKIFTFERKCYTRQELAHHRRKGDVDDTSHRGHPLCEFCEERFMDSDELYRHLRKEHLYCHLCDADGRNLYYASHSALAHHFRTDHYLCEEGECSGQHLTAVFRSEIDLKAHKATVHGRGMPRGATRQARTLELQFNITPHPSLQRTPRHNEREREREREPSPPPVQQPAPRIDTRSDEHFPRLSATQPVPPPLLPTPNLNFNGSSGLARTDRNFPTLGGAPAAAAPRPRAPPASGAAAAVLRNSKPSVSIQLHSQPTSASNFRLTQTSGNRISIPQQQKRPPVMSDDDFPSLGMRDDHFPSLGMRDDHPSVGAGTVQPSKVTMINSQEMQNIKKNSESSQPKKPQLSSEAFPALSSTPAPHSSPPKWLPATKGKKKSSPPPQPASPPQPSFNPAADFPTLPKAKKKQAPIKVAPSPRPIQPAPSPRPIQPTPAPVQVAPPQNTEKTKKEKKKNNAKKENLSEPNFNINGLGKKLKGVDLQESTQAIIDPKIKTIDSKPSNSVEKPKNGKGNGDFKLAKHDYPPLSSKSDNSIPNNVEVPCYRSKITNGSVPPGFSSKPRPTCNGMTFTNSAGQTFSAPLHSYISPPNFEGRNMALVKKFTAALCNAAALENFKVASRAFRDSIATADDFYEHCRTALGDKFDDVFPELVALLPDIAKQQELMVGRTIPELEVCHTCGQLLAPCDQISHDAAHWPPLC